MLGNVDLGQQAQQIGLPILHGHIYTSTLWIMTRGISEEVGAWPHCDVLHIDRAVPDTLGYYLAALDYRSETPDEAAITHLQTLAAQHSRQYDLIFRTVLDDTMPVGTTKPRDPDTRYRTLADPHVGQVLIDLGIPHRLLHCGEHAAAIEYSTRFALRCLSGVETEAPIGLAASGSGGRRTVPPQAPVGARGPPTSRPGRSGRPSRLPTAGSRRPARTTGA